VQIKKGITKNEIPGFLVLKFLDPNKAPKKNVKNTVANSKGRVILYSPMSGKGYLVL